VQLLQKRSGDSKHANVSPSPSYCDYNGILISPKRRLFFGSLIGVFVAHSRTCSFSLVPMYVTIEENTIPGEAAKPPSPGLKSNFPDHSSWDQSNQEPTDAHPISGKTDEKKQMVTEVREIRQRHSKETVSKYRKYGRHPPPGFKRIGISMRGTGMYTTSLTTSIMDTCGPLSWATYYGTCQLLCGRMIGHGSHIFGTIKNVKQPVLAGPRTMVTLIEGSSSSIFRTWT